MKKRTYIARVVKGTGKLNKILRWESKGAYTVKADAIRIAKRKAKAMGYGRPVVVMVTGKTKFDI